jgi:chaperonin GroES
MVDVARKIASSEVRCYEPAMDMVLVEMHEPGKTAGGIELPEGYRDNAPQKCTVVAVGPGRLLEDGGRGPMQCKVGDVTYMQFRGNVVKFDKGVLSEDREYLLLSDQQVTGFYRKDGGAGGRVK